MAGSSQSELLSTAMVVSELIASRLEGPFRSVGLNFGMFELLAAVHAGKGVASQAMLASRLGITAASLCEAVASAVRKGFVEQTPSPSDRRVKLVRLTPLGDRSLRSALEAFADLEREVSGNLTPYQRDHATNALDALTSALGRKDA